MPYATVTMRSGEVHENMTLGGADNGSDRGMTLHFLSPATGGWELLNWADIATIELADTYITPDAD